MKKSEELKQQSREEENDFKAYALHIKSQREKRGEDFKEDILPLLLKKYYVECDEFYSKYTINLDELGFGIVDFFPKKNRLLIRKDNKWINGGKEWIKTKVL